jgi:DNA modification methylase
MKSLSNHLSVDRVPIDSLKPSEPVLRRHPKKQMDILRRGLERFGQIIPIPVTPDSQIIDLELVWRALKANGASHVDVTFVADRSPAEITALRLALNRTAQDAVWDDQNLRAVLEELISIDFDLDLTGFPAPEIDQRLNLDLPQANVEENGSDIPSVEGIAISERGTIWALDKSRIGCGDATDPIFVNRVLDDRLADVCFIDAPYNLKVNGFISGKGKHRHREFVQGAGELSDDVFFDFLRQSLEVLRTSSTPAALIYSCIDWRHVTEMNVAARLCGMPLYNICVWVKPNGGMGGIYRNAHEFVCVYLAGAERPRDNVELGRHGRNRTNVWSSYGGMSSFGKDRDELLGSHPTVKPVAMIADALRDVTKRGGLVLDTFLGSGSTLMAAHETGRICCGVELDPLYVDVAVRRWQNATGRDAVSVETGETFNVITLRRRLAEPSECNDGT